MVSDQEIKHILQHTRTIAVVGASNNPERASYQVMMALAARGYDVIAVNPGLAGKIIEHIPVVSSLKDIDQPIDMVDIFRNSAAAGEVVEDALALPVLPKTIWMQLGVIHEPAAMKARQRGVSVVMDRCPKIELARLGIHGPERDRS